ncbi:MAG TPA: DUF72 domain-containing protein [Nitrososphaera sp.]|nr:DUF72 domain-containing protein [Nitrososphaera sp.]
MGRLDGKNALVGAGGWLQYKEHKVPTDERLSAYANEFDFVEVNSLFYQLIHPQTVERWRKSVPTDFEFSIKCYQALTHKIGLRPVEDAFRVFAMMQKYCEILNSKILVMQMPPSLKLDEKFVLDARAFFKSIDFGDLRFVFEFRVTTTRMPGNLLNMLRDFNMVHTVDLTFEDPRVETNLLYSRVFGMPEKHNALDDKDLQVLKEKVEKSKAPDVRVVGHSLKMIEDTRRIKETLYT